MRKRFRPPTDRGDEIPPNTSGPLKKAFAVFSGLMILTYWAMGLYLIWKKNLVPSLGPELNIALGVMLVIYGFVRGMRLYRNSSND